ncbi:erythronate-4-phosphate dehydrogenase family protein [Tasmannia lanceolata]|uniref:erythronate-4-phosphate dehydrogenase family protein n=1 Tax=Tasmannia lanceolata TaxID=3420 RepID=UPI004062A68F
MDLDDYPEENPSIAICPAKKTQNYPHYRLTNGPTCPPLGWFEIRLFYVRISPCIIDSVPHHLTLCHLRREIGVALEINGSRIPATEIASLTLRRDRLDKESSEVTYVSTDSIKITGAAEFEVYENQDMILCGSIERMDSPWNNGNDSKTGWSMDCYSAASIAGGSSAFFQPKLGISSPSIEVYVAGCCSGFPLILTKTIQVSPRRKIARQRMLDSIPEDEETERERRSVNGVIQHRRLHSVPDGEIDDYDSEEKTDHRFYAETMYPDDDGQLSWFNAGVRVGVGIGLGMCLGIGIGVGLLMRSYQATTRTFRRRFF